MKADLDISPDAHHWIEKKSQAGVNPGRILSRVISAIAQLEEEKGEEVTLQTIQKGITAPLETKERLENLLQDYQRTNAIARETLQTLQLLASQMRVNYVLNKEGKPKILLSKAALEEIYPNQEPQQEQTEAFTQ